MSERVVVTGLGVVSSLGHQIDEFWANLVGATSGISAVSSFDVSQLERRYAGEVKDFTFSGLSSMEVMPRTHQFALSASQCALQDADIHAMSEVGVAIGSLAGGLEAIESKTVPFDYYPVSTVTASVCKALNLKGPAFTMSCACAAGNYALSFGYDLIKDGKVSIFLAGGADYFSMSIFLSFYKLFSLAPQRCQPFDKNRRGLLPAEGAGMLVLEGLSSARARGANIYAEIIGYGVSVDAYHPVIPSVEGIYACMKNALEATGLMASDIDYISAHGTGTIPNDKVECAAIKRLFGQKHSKQIPVSSIKSMLGHTMGAASSMEAISCCLAIERGVIPPTINYETPDPECDIDCVPNEARKQKSKFVLNNSFGFGGMNCSLVLGAYGS